MLGQADSGVGPAVCQQPIEQVSDLVDAPGERRDVPLAEKPWVRVARPMLLQRSQAIGSGDPGISVHPAQPPVRSLDIGDLRARRRGSRTPCAPRGGPRRLVASGLLTTR